MRESRNWDELMTNILERVGAIEIFKSLRKVCRSWRRIFKDPAMWKVIPIHKSFDKRDEWNTSYVLETLTKQAVDLRRGELIEASIQSFGTNDLLDHIVLRSSKLKSLCLTNCFGITGSGLSRAVKRVPQLEKLDISYISINAKDIEFIGRNCPRLKSFAMGKI